MNHTTAMRAFQTLADIGPVLQNLRNRKRAFGQTIGQSFTFQKFHDQVVGSILMANIVERANVGMVQGGDGSRFSVESLLGFGVLGQMVGKDFYSDGAVEASVEGAIDLSHAACA